MTIQDDDAHELMRRYARGEDHVFERLYALLAPRLYRFCQRLARRPSEGDDYFQETFLRLHRARATYLACVHPLHWAFAIARSVHLNGLRYRRRRPDGESLANDTADNYGLSADGRYDPEADTRAHHLVTIVTRTLHRMSEKNRVAYVLLREEELSVRDAALILGTTPDVVKQRAHRAGAQVRAAVHAAGWTTGEDASRSGLRERVSRNASLPAIEEANTS